MIFSIVALVNDGECKSHYPLSTSNYLDRNVRLLKKLIVWGLEIPAILEFAMCSQFHISTAGFGSFEFPRPPKHQHYKAGAQNGHPSRLVEKNQPSKTYGGFHSHGVTPLAGWFISWKIPSKIPSING